MAEQQVAVPNFACPVNIAPKRNAINEQPLNAELTAGSTTPCDHECAIYRLGATRAMFFAL
jgi:hypothetical protein